LKIEANMKESEAWMNWVKSID